MSETSFLAVYVITSLCSKQNNDFKVISSIMVDPVELGSFVITKSSYAVNGPHQMLLAEHFDFSFGNTHFPAMQLRFCFI